MGGFAIATASTEEYLEAIYKLRDEGSDPISARLAERLGVSAPSVAEMLKKLVKAGYVGVNEAKEISLTDQGRELAETLIRRHRLSERLLTDVLGISWERVHDEACRLEHAISPEVEEGLARALGNPETCPHGYPIPGSGVVTERRLRLLKDTDDGTTVVVERVAEEDTEFLEYLSGLGLVPGATVTVVEHAPYNGPIRLQVSDHDVAVGTEVAARVWVA